MRIFYNVAFSLLVVCFFAPPIFSQQTGEDESLKEPVTVQREVGVYKGINSLPESLRRSKIFARGLHELQHYAGFDGVYDRQARIDAFEQSKADVGTGRAARTSDTASGSKLPVFSGMPGRISTGELRRHDKIPCLRSDK